MFYLVVRSDYTVMQVWSVLRIVEENQLARLLIKTWMCGYAVERYPGLGTKLLQGVWIQAIAFAALIKRGKNLAGMDDDVGRGRIL